MWLQKFTTREPDESQIEVAIAAFNAVLPENKEEIKEATKEETKEETKKSRILLTFSDERSIF